MRVVPAVRTQDAADAMAQALSGRATRTGVRGRLVATGNATIRPGDLVEARGLPSGDLGTLRVIGVEHVLDGRTGYITALAVEAAS